MFEIIEELKLEDQKAMKTEQCLILILFYRYVPGIV